MKEKTVKTFRVFLASSNELSKDREDFERLISRLNHHYESRGIHFIFDIWEYLDPTYMDRRKQDEYNEYVKKCDVFVALFYLKAGGFTLEEFTVAEQENKKRKLPLFIYFKEGVNGSDEKESLELTKFKNHIELQLKHFWGRYATTPELHLDFALWLDNYLYGSKGNTKIVNGCVMLDDVIVTKLLQLPFASNNEDFKRMYQAAQEFPAKIEKLRKRTEKYPDDQEIHDELQEALNEYDDLTKKFKGYQQNLLDTAKLIADKSQEQISEKLQRAMEAFKTGDMAGANAILREIAIEADDHMAQFDKDKTLIHQDIEAFQLQAKTEMADLSTPIEERIARVAEIYAKADDWASRSAYDKEKYAKLLFDYADFLFNYAHYNESVKIYLRQIALSEELYGKDSTDTAISYNNIGLVYDNKGDYDKALEYYSKALNIKEKVLGKEHPSTATSYNNIAGVYDSKGDYDKALEYHFKALDIREKVLGKEHPDTATSYNNIGLVYKRQGNYDKALEYYFKALYIDEKVLGKEHPHTATDYNNIAGVYYSKGDYVKALEFYFKALDIREKVLGKEHPDTATDYNNIGSVYWKQGIYDKALEYYFKAMHVYETVLGLKHPLIATSYNNIGTVYDDKGDYDKALEYYEKALDIKEKVLGKEHPSTANSYNNIGLVYKRQGDYDKALEFYFKALDIDEKVLGREHPSTATSYNNIGLVYKRQGNYDKALEYYFKALYIDEKVLGKEHSDTAIDYNNIGSVYKNQGDYDKALEYYEKAISILLKILGPDHPSTKAVQGNVDFLKLMKKLRELGSQLNEEQ